MENKTAQVNGLPPPPPPPRSHASDKMFAKQMHDNDERLRLGDFSENLILILFFDHFITVATTTAVCDTTLMAQNTHRNGIKMCAATGHRLNCRSFDEKFISFLILQRGPK